MSNSSTVESFYAELVAHGLIIPAGVKGGYARGNVFEEILEGFVDLLKRTTRNDGAERMRFPPIVARSLIEDLGYMNSFPQLIGSISCFCDNEEQARVLSERIHAHQDWGDLLETTESMLVPAACYPVYPIFSGVLPPGGRLVTVTNWIYRHEPSSDPARLQSFRMLEFIRAAASEEVTAWRALWLERALVLLRSLQLPVSSNVATDPFFGRGGRIMESSQRDQQLKFEIAMPMTSAEEATALCSFNWHQDKFSAALGIHTNDGHLASTACVGFGLERITLALIKTHGFDPKSWPLDIRALLWPSAGQLF